MASAAIFSSLRRRRSPSLEAFLAPVNLSDGALLQTLTAVSGDLVSGFSGKRLLFQSKNTRSLIRKVTVFLMVLDYLKDSSLKRPLPPKAVLCLKELYLLLYRSKIVLDYCSLSSKLWLLLQTPSISGHFHDLNQEISTLLDVFPISDLGLSEDVKEQIELLHKQCRREKLYVDESDEELRITLFKFLNEFENHRVPDEFELKIFFLEKLEIRDAKSCRAEIEFLEEQIVNNEGDVEPSGSVLNGFVALTRYCRFLLFGFEEDEVQLRNLNRRKPMRRINGDSFIVTVPKDFSCPISLDLMLDPVVISTGQTYDRSSITRWMEEGHCTCPKTGQTLAHARLVRNRALRNLIIQWCAAHGIQYSPLENVDDGLAPALPSVAALEANKASMELLIEELGNGSELGKAIAAREIRLLSKTWKENRAFIAEAGAIPYLHKLLLSSNPVAQENSVTAMLNLSIYEKNKGLIVGEERCLGSIVGVLRFGHTTEARENAAATLFSLSAVHEYKKRIGDEEGAVEALAWLLREGSARGKKDAVTALFNLSTHAENCPRMIASGAVGALVGALGDEAVAEEAAGSLALIVRQPVGAQHVAKDEEAVIGLISMMRCGTPRGKENAVAALLEFCRSGGGVATERVLKAPALGGLLQSLLFSGTKRARRKAASLARVFRRSENATSFQYDGYLNSIGARRDMTYGGEVSVVPLPISVPVL